MAAFLVLFLVCAPNSEQRPCRGLSNDRFSFYLHLLLQGTGKMTRTSTAALLCRGCGNAGQIQLP